MTIITLASDFGTVDAYVGIMKGVILSIAPSVRLVDLSHAIPAQNVHQAARLLARSVPYFPHGTVHLAVVDPGVGGQRRPLLVQTLHAFYVGPDNGLFTCALTEPGVQAYELNQPRFWLPQVSRTFHGRDIFAPVAAHLARGVCATRLGRPIADAVHLAFAAPVRHSDGHLSGEVTHVDRFGNLITDVPARWITGGPWKCCIAGETAPLVTVYVEAQPGALLALVSSGDTVEVAVRGGSAAERLSARVGEPVTIWPMAES